MDDSKISNIKTQISNVQQAGFLNKEAERPVQTFVEPSEPSPKISPELGEYVQSSEIQPPQNEIIKVSGENVPVSTAPQGVVKLPEIPERQKAKEALKLGPKEGGAWKGLEIIREIDKDQLEAMRARLRELKEAA